MTTSIPFSAMNDPALHPVPSRVAAGAFRLFLLLLLPVMGCDSPTESVLTFWEGNLVPVLPAHVSGQAAAVTQFGRTEVSIQIQEAEPDQFYRWNVVSGSCQDPGLIQGGESQYLILQPNAGGGASADAVLAKVFRSGDRFAVRVFLIPSEGPDELVACGDLEETQK